MLPESRDVQPFLISGGPKRIRSCQHLAPLLMEDLCCPSTHVAKALLSQWCCEYHHTEHRKLDDGPCATWSDADCNGSALCLYVPTKPCSALAHGQMHHTHTGSSCTVSEAAAALSAGDHNHITVLPTVKVLGKGHGDFDHAMPCCT